MGRRITILGMGPSANERRWDIVRYVEDTEVWGLNNGFAKFGDFAKWSRWYEIHGIEYLSKWCVTNGELDYFRAIDALAVPCYRTDVLPIVKNQAHFPELEMARHFGSNYWDGTPSRMFAHAIYEHDKGATIDYIQSYGIDMQDSQHAPQMGAWCFWLAMAHARRIKLGGTMLDRIQGAESDEGTQHLRPIISAGMLYGKAKGRTDYTLVSCNSPEYQARADVLAGQCDALGIAHNFLKLPDYPDFRAANEALNTVIFDHAWQVAHATGKPVIFLCADDELLDVPTLPNGDGHGFGWWANPEKQIIGTTLAVGMGFALWPGDLGRQAYEQLLQIARVAGNAHRTECAYVALSDGSMAKHSGTVDVSRNVRGCIKINPGHNRPAECRT